MNPKIIVGIVVAAVIGIIAVIGVSGQSVIGNITEDDLFSPSAQPNPTLPLELELTDISISQLTEQAVWIDIKIKATNPNNNSILLKLVKYDIYENGEKVHAGSIGERPEAFVMGAQFFTILSNASINLPEKAIIKNTGNTPEFWEALENDTPSWSIKGTAFYNMSSMTSGGEQELEFEFTK